MRWTEDLVRQALQHADRQVRTAALDYFAMSFSRNPAIMRDVIMAIDEQPVEGTFDLNKVLIPKKPGDKVKVQYWSKGKVQTKTMTLQEVHQQNP